LQSKHLEFGTSAKELNLMETRQQRFDPESLLSSESQPCTLMQSSRTLDWSDLLLDIQRGYGQSSIFETHSTGDISLVVKLKGCSSVKVLTNGRWQHAFYEVGCGGLTARHQTNRLQFEVQKSDPFAETAHLYLAQVVLDEVAEDYRRIGARDIDRHLNALVFSDETIFHTTLALTRALTAGAPSLYAEQTVSFLSAHLLSQHAAWWNPDNDGRTSHQLTDRRLRRAVEYMSVSLDLPLTLHDIAAEAGLSKHHFLREFRAVTGSTPFKYLQKLRLETARRLLRTSQLPVAEIGYRCGFTRASNFSTVFTNHFGATPTVYRSTAG